MFNVVCQSFTEDECSPTFFQRCLFNVVCSTLFLSPSQRTNALRHSFSVLDDDATFSNVVSLF